MANLFRLYLHALAHNLLVRLRRVVADPPPEPTQADVPQEALAGRERRRRLPTAAASATRSAKAKRAHGGRG